MTKPATLFFDLFNTFGANPNKLNLLVNATLCVFPSRFIYYILYTHVFHMLQTLKLTINLTVRIRKKQNLVGSIPGFNPSKLFFLVLQISLLSLSVLK